MAELGADVIKVEQAPLGDPARQFAFSKEGRSAYFVQQNRGKRSICLDLASPKAASLVMQLATQVDILVENRGPGFLERRGLGWEELKKANPRLVMASISGYGQGNSFSERPGLDMIAQALSGFMAVTGEFDGSPMPVGVPIGDATSGVHALAAIGFALYYRAVNGQGQQLDISMVDSLFHQLDMHVQGPSVTKGRWRYKRGGSKSSVNVPHGVFKSPEGWIAVQAMPRQWPGFCQAINRTEWLEDARFADFVQRSKRILELNELIQERFLEYASDAELLGALDAESVPCSQVVDPADAAAHPYFQERDMVRTVTDPLLGEVQIPGMPLRFSMQRELPDLVAPVLGQHNRQVLAELGYDELSIGELERDRVLHAGTT
jgi:crotonobetainyl-CoA:carnitine CoA-transferase CaiB-like acyl-CoA transferase